MRVHRRLDHPPHAIGIGDIHLDRGRRSAFAARRGGGCLRRRRIHVGDGDLRPLGGEAQAGGAANPGAAAGDDANLVGKTRAGLAQPFTAPAPQPEIR